MIAPLAAPSPSAPAKAPYPLVSVRNLCKHYALRAGWGFGHSVFKAVENVSFDIMPNETLGLVGESGSGKSTIGRAVTMLNPPTSGVVAFEGVDLAEQSGRDMRRMRQRMQMVFQDPYSALNPRMTVGDYVAEPLVIHGLCKTAAERRDLVAELFSKVGLDPRFMARFPHQFSGGQRQRICIARALACEPELLIADEAVAALDVSIQAQIVNLLMELQEKRGLSYIFISHDMAVVERVSHRVAVMYLGQIVELGPRQAVFDRPAHPYTRRLMAAVPIADPARRDRERPLLEGEIPSAIRAIGDPPLVRPLVEVGEGHFVARHPIGDFA